jgi:DNA-binding transcriptional regulator LsrR (DeoR family)
MAARAEDDERRLAVRIAKMHYEDGLKQKEIVRKLNEIARKAYITRFKVCRLLKVARKRKWFRLSVIGLPAESTTERLGTRLREEFAIKDLVVNGQSRADAGRAAAMYFHDYSRDRTTVVLDGGRSISAFVDSLRVGTRVGLTLIPFCADPATDPLSADEMVTRMALKYCDDVQWKRLPQQPGGPYHSNIMKEIRLVARGAGFVLLGVNGFEREEDFGAFPWIPHMGYRTRDVKKESKGVVAICGNLGIDEHGKRASLGEIEKRMTWALDFDDLVHLAARRSCIVAVLAAGAKKAKAMSCVLKARIVNTLVIDEALARELLRHLDASAQGGT